MGCSRMKYLIDWGRKTKKGDEMWGTCDRGLIPRGTVQGKQDFDAYVLMQLVDNDGILPIHMCLFSQEVDSNPSLAKDHHRSRGKEQKQWIPSKGTGIHRMAESSPAGQYHDQWEPQIDLDAVWMPSSNAPRDGDPMCAHEVPGADLICGTPDGAEGWEYSDPRQTYYQCRDMITPDLIYTAPATCYDCAMTTQSAHDNVRAATPVLIDSGSPCTVAGMEWLEKRNSNLSATLTPSSRSFRFGSGDEWGAIGAVNLEIAVPAKYVSTGAPYPVMIAMDIDNLDVPILISRKTLPNMSAQLAFLGNTFLLRYGGCGGGGSP